LEFNKSSSNNKKEDREERVAAAAAAEMAPKQATLGYVKSGQMTLGWVITAAKILA
jgi:molybdenum cofactor biosynthesis enzyme